MRLALNLACGDDIKESSEDLEWINVDHRELSRVDIVTKVEERLPWEDETFDLLYASHILEHFGKKSVKGILQEWIRIVKPGGKVYLAVPDLQRVTEEFVNGPLGFHSMLDYIYGGQGYKGNFHKTGFCQMTLSDLMGECGLKDIARWPQGAYNDASNSKLSLNLRGTKA